MSIHRSGPTPPFWEYVCKWALAELPLSQAANELRPTLIRVPSFQRGISWGEEEVLNFLRSDSVLFGNTVIGMFEGQPGILVDGLQRFATGTVLLHLLYRHVLSSSPCMQEHSHKFTRLRAAVQNYQPIFDHNHNVLLDHPRRSIKEQYQVLSKELEGQIGSWIKQYHNEINATFLDKQIAVDEYWNFNSSIELANTFIGLNTVRVELGTVDLIRSYIVDRAESCTPAWDEGHIAEAENEITDTLTRDGKERRDLLPFATVILKCVQSRGNLCPDLIFPNWKQSFSKQEVDELLGFVRKGIESQNDYVKEIIECGGLPFSILMLFYYGQFLQRGSEPTFMAGQTAEDPELHRFLCACFRSVIDGSVGRIGQVAEDVARGQYASLVQVADAINPPGAGGLDSDPVGEWLRSNLAVADTKKARRIFNACLLPLRTNRGGAFQPLQYGRGQWNIDHLIPVRNVQRAQPGGREANTLRNLAPLPAPHNRGAGNEPCSQKLSPTGRYAAAIEAGSIHPYMQWLLDHQATIGSPLDDQRLLEPNARPPIGDERIEAIAELLIAKL